MLKNALRTMPVVAVLVALVVSLVPAGFAMADDASITVVANYQDDVVVQRDSADANELPTLDPQLAGDAISIPAIENMFHGLTDYDPLTSQVVPELATSWTTSEDGLEWTFTLRNDVMWYRYDPATDTAAELRPVVAGDVVYGIKRACDARLGSYYGSIASSVIDGCNTVIGTAAEETTDDLVYGDTTQVSAPDDTTVVIKLQFAAGYFFSMTPMWMLRPVHQETIEEFGDEWTAPGNIATNGPYFVKEISRGVRRVFVRNENHIADLGYG
jgi:oligopeptide transport system substrate-binding protein